jgi:diguanylate cyclase (GGDEF)-like protein
VGNVQQLCRLSAITVASFLIAQLAERHLYQYIGLTVDTLPAEVFEVAVIFGMSALLIWPLVLRPLQEQATAARADADAREQLLRADRNTQAFHARLHRALEMTKSEAGAHEVARRALSDLVGGSAQLMLADSSEAHLKSVMRLEGPRPRSGCAVVTPHDCPAVNRGQTMVYANDRDLDACPWLVSRTDETTSAVCVPVSTIGRSIGVLHVPSGPVDLPNPEQLTRIEAVAEQVGARIGTIRVMEQTHLQAATDPLTGLLNRRSVENQAQALIRQAAPFALAMGDLDNFKLLNDTHGHEAGDRALRQFARVMRTVLRQEDLISRFGGEEFVIVFPQLGIGGAASALRRVQEHLLLTVAGGSTPPFTVTFGVAEASQANSLEELIRVADAALFQGKREGRNRIIQAAGATAG